MASMNQADLSASSPHFTCISRHSSTHTMTHPAAFSSALTSDYQERYLMEMQHASYRRSSSRNGYHQPPPVDSAPVWQLAGSSASDLHHRHSADKETSREGSMAGSERGAADSMNRGSPASIQSSSSEQQLFDGTVVSRGDWQQQFVDSGSRYSSVLHTSSGPLHPHNSGHLHPHNHASHAAARGVNEGAMIRELIGRLGVNSLGSNGISNLGSSPQQPLAAGMEKAINAWNSAAEVPSNVGFISVDPSKGGLSLNGGVGLAASHPLAHFSSDPGFAERAARFSSFSNGNHAQPFSSSTISDGAGNRRSRSSSTLLSETSTKHLSRTSSCPPLRESSARVNSPTDSSVICDNRASSGSDSLLIEEGNGAVEGRRLAVEMLSRTASSLIPTEEDGACDEDAVGIQGMPSPEQAVTEETSPSGVSGATDSSAKKRKSIISEEKTRDVGPGTSHGERDTKAVESEDGNLKRYRRGGEGSADLKDEFKLKAERSSSETSGESSPRSMKDHSKPSEPPKPDYIHVRARRGQATDSHSLAERVRREKISERMKFLQDLVPGCSKVTGKAVMLDEIINYVQSLQRQVEFLSMKLASVNPRLDFNPESYLGKEGPPHPGSQAVSLGPESSVPYSQMHPQHQVQHLGLLRGLDYHPLHSEVTLTRSMSMPHIAAANPHVDGYGNGVSQLQTVWDDGELQSIVQMGFGHGTQSKSPQGLLHCHVPPGQVKVELQQSPISCL